jgi:Na+(H+)/acetate symporter ActP
MNPHPQIVMSSTYIKGKMSGFGLLLLRMDRIKTTVVVVHAIFFFIVLHVKFDARTSVFLYVLVASFLLQGAASCPCT